MRYLILACLLAFLAGCSDAPDDPETPKAPAVPVVTNEPAAATEASTETPGTRLAQEMLIVDTHIDVPFRLYRNPEDVGLATESGQFDYPRAKAGGLNAPFMSIYIPAAVDEEGKAKALADELIDMVEGIAAKHPDKFAVAATTADLIKQKEEGRISLAMGMENGAPIEGNLDNLKHFYDRGIRYITLAHSKSNHISDSSYDENRQWGGLSDFGKTLVKEMNRLGVMVDVSHISDEAFYDVMDLSVVPVIASHSSARHFVPGFERNMDDDMIRRLAGAGGVMLLNIGSSFISQASRESGDKRSKLVSDYLTEHNIAPESDAAKDARGKIYAENPYVYATMEDVLNHIDHVVGIGGIDAIGIGTDFDGVGDSLPVGFKDVADYPNLIDGLLERGYREDQIRKILGGNLMRVWNRVERYAESVETM